MEGCGDVHATAKGCFAGEATILVEVEESTLRSSALAEALLSSPATHDDTAGCAAA